MEHTDDLEREQEKSKIVMKNLDELIDHARDTKDASERYARLVLMLAAVNIVSWILSHWLTGLPAFFFTLTDIVTVIAFWWFILETAEMGGKVRGISYTLRKLFPKELMEATKKE